MERLLIRGLALFGHHGVNAEERRQGQSFLVDAQLEIERLSRADELSETVDYTAVVETIRQLNNAHQFRLLESFARALAEELIERFPQVRRAKVRVRKRLLWAGVDLDWVAAETICSREGSS